MRLLILGGTLFLGRALVEAAAAAGHEVALFNRGETNPGLGRATRARPRRHRRPPGADRGAGRSDRASKLETDLDFDAVQRIGLAAGLVDNKSCAIDADWQALRFVRRLSDR